MSESERTQKLTTKSELMKLKRILTHKNSNHKVIGREPEYNKIISFIEKQLELDEGNSLLICSNPQTGKHVIIRNIAGYCMSKVSNTNNLKNIIKINVPSLRHPKSIYSILCRNVINDGSTVKAMDAQNKLEQYFIHSSPKYHKMYMVFINEIDSLLVNNDNNQSILTNLFRWSKIKNSTLILVGIANSIDLTIASGFVSQLQRKYDHNQPEFVIFKTQTKTELTKIVTQRLGHLGLVKKYFVHKAMRLLIQKVAEKHDGFGKLFEIVVQAVNILSNGNNVNKKVGFVEMQQLLSKHYPTHTSTTHTPKLTTHKPLKTTTSKPTTHIATTPKSKFKIALNDSIANLSNYKYIDIRGTKSRRSKKKRIHKNKLNIPKKTKRKRRKTPKKEEKKEERKPVKQLIKLKNNKTMRIVGLPKGIESQTVLKNIFSKFGVIENVVFVKAKGNKQQRWAQIEYNKTESAKQAIAWSNTVVFEFEGKCLKLKATTGWSQRCKYLKNQTNNIITKQEQQQFDETQSGEIGNAVYSIDMNREVTIKNVMQVYKQNEYLSQEISKLKNKLNENEIMRLQQKLLTQETNLKLFGREREYEKIVSFIKKQIKLNSGNVLFASGSDESGISGTIEKVADYFMSNTGKYNDIIHVTHINANSLNNDDLTSSYSFLYNKIINKNKTTDIPPIRCKNKLKKILCGKSSKHHKFYFVIMDKMDNLLINTKHQSIINHLFQWSKRKNSKLIIFGIANSIELMDIFVKKNHENELSLIFKPYTKKELITVIRNALDGNADKYFENIALALCTQKVAVMKGGVGKLLEIVRNALDILLDNNNKNYTTKIGFAQMQQILSPPFNEKE